MRSLTSVLALALAACASAPRAQPATVRLIAPPNAAPIVAALKRRPELRLAIQRPNQALPAPRSRSAAGAQQARRALDNARGAFRELRLAAAIEQLRAGERALLQRRLDRDALHLLRDIRLLHGRCLLAETKPQKAADSIALALALSDALGEKLAPSGSLPPETDSFVKQAAQRVASAPRARLRVVSEPPGARLIIDGTARGTTPAALELAAGPHLLQLTRLGRLDRVEVVTLSAASEQRHDAVLTPAPASDLRAQLADHVATDRATPPLQQLAGPALAGALQAPVGWLEARPPPTGGASARADLGWVDAGGRVQPVACQRPNPNDVARCLARSLYRLATGKPAPNSASSDRRSGSIWRRWWLWTAIGVAAAGGAAAVVLATSGDSGTDVYIEPKR